MNGSTLIRGPSTPLDRIAAAPARQRDQISPQLADDAIALLCELATEIRNELGDGSVLLPRIRSLRDRIDTARVIVEGR